MLPPAISGCYCLLLLAVAGCYQKQIAASLAADAASSKTFNGASSGEMLLVLAKVCSIQLPMRRSGVHIM